LSPKIPLPAGKKFAFAPVSRPINSEKRPADQTLTDRFGAFSLCRAGNLAGELAAEFCKFALPQGA
jgi:hypothetical protein